jgi:hypothetical protein
MQPHARVATDMGGHGAAALTRRSKSIPTRRSQWPSWRSTARTPPGHRPDTARTLGGVLSWLQSASWIAGACSPRVPARFQSRGQQPTTTRASAAATGARWRRVQGMMTEPWLRGAIASSLRPPSTRDIRLRPAPTAREPCSHQSRKNTRAPKPHKVPPNPQAAPRGHASRAAFPSARGRGRQASSIVAAPSIRS